MRQLGQRLGLILGGALASLALVEASLHLFPGLLPPAVRQALAIYNDSHQTRYINQPFVANDELIYVPRPGVDLEIHDGLTLKYTVRTRSLGDPTVGFRDIGPTTPAYGVAIGDSFTWGTYVDADQTWPEQLEARVGAPVINLGVLGYGPIQYQIVTERHALPLHPRVVLWGFFAGNDFIGSTDYLEWEKAGKGYTGLSEPATGLRDFLARDVWLFELLKFALHLGIYYQRGATEGATFVPAPGGPDWTFYPDVLERLADGRRPDVAEGWSLTEQALLETDSEAPANGAQFVIVIIPPKELVYWDALRRRLADPSAYDLAEPERTPTTFCRAQKLHCLDLTPTLADQAGAGQELYFRQDAQLNPAGHRLVAETIALYLQEQNLLL